ncbi:TPA: phosphoenolpyruvate synthase [Candidatus Uhrbacteria bacterium]|nr:phosphoenolpyruvate synthase [Candidatus Uhrbacteria bacterium]
MTKKERGRNRGKRQRSLGRFVYPFGKLDMGDVGLVGGKNASLGEMFRHLSRRGVRVPDGFAVGSDAYWHFIDGAGLRDKIAVALKGLDATDVKELAKRGELVRKMVLQAEVPADLTKYILSAYRKLSTKYGMDNCDVAVRSSATAEDLPGASFAGQQETFLNVHGETALIDAIRRCFASLFTNRAIAYRQEKGFDHLKVALSVGVQKMIRSDLASAGVMFTVDTESGFRDVVLINAAYGLGESVVQGKINPDQYFVFKPPLLEGKRPIVGKDIGDKETRIEYATKSDSPVREVSVPVKKRRLFCLTDDEVLQLAKWGVTIEQYYSRLVGHDQPMDIEWAKDGQTGELYIVQARPETVQSERDPNTLEEYRLKESGQVLASGLSVGFRIGQGKVRIVRSASDMSKFQTGEVLVTEMTDPDWVPIMKRASAIITESGGRTCHAAIVSRELGTPAVVGVSGATSTLKNGQEVTVSCAEGEDGRIYAGLLPFEVKRTKLRGFKKPQTQVMMNVGEPDLAFEFSFIPNAGVGLARTEFIFTNFIKAHPLALLHYDRLGTKDRRAVDELTLAYDGREEFFISRLAEGIGRLAAAFWPNDVIVRSSDFKSNEYAGLIGGRTFEPEESNPMIGWRGASRYYDPKYEPAFLLECEAFRRVREVMGLTNVVIMIPFCRTPEEGKQVLKTMAKAGLRRGKNGLRVFVMIEIPSNIILADKFAEVFDGFSIGSNDLTQLTLGVDRDSELVSHLYNERNSAVLESIRSVIRTAKQKSVKIGICGQAPSDYPEFAEFLVREGIDSISLNPDTVLKTSMRLRKFEERLKRERGNKKMFVKRKSEKI